MKDEVRMGPAQLDVAGDSREPKLNLEGCGISQDLEDGLELAGCTVGDGTHWLSHLG